MDKTSTRQIIIISILLIALYAVIKTDDFNDKINKLLDKNEQTEAELQNTDTSTTPNVVVSTPFYKSGNYKSSEIDGKIFCEKMKVLEEYRKIFTDSFDYAELTQAAKEVDLFDIHEYYIPYKESIMNALKQKARKVKKGASLYDSEYVAWQNETLKELFDTMEDCFESAGIEYTRLSDTEIQYWYHTTR